MNDVIKFIKKTPQNVKKKKKKKKKKKGGVMDKCAASNFLGYQLEV